MRWYGAGTTDKEEEPEKAHEPGPCTLYALGLIDGFMPMTGWLQPCEDGAWSASSCMHPSGGLSSKRGEITRAGKRTEQTFGAAPQWELDEKRELLHVYAFFLLGRPAKFHAACVI